MDFLSRLFKSLVAFFAGTASLILPARPPTPTPTPLPTPTPTPTPIVRLAPTVTLGQNISISGFQPFSASGIRYNLEFPSFGGTVKGSFSGLCNGTITGNYSYTGGDQGNISGDIAGTCTIPLLPPDLNVKYQGVVHLSSRKIDLSWTGTTPLGPTSGSTTVSF